MKWPHKITDYRISFLWSVGLDTVSFVQLRCFGFDEMFELEVKRLERLCRLKPSNLHLPKAYTEPPKSASIEQKKLHIYRTTRSYFSCIRIIEAFNYTMCLDVRDTLVQIMSSFENLEHKSLYFHTRNLLETVAAFNDGSEKIKRFLTEYETKCVKNPPNLEDMVWIRNIKFFYDQAMPIVLPSSLDPRKLAGGQAVRDRDGILSNSNILTKLKKLERNVEGLEEFYDLLSEFIHPNSFPFLNNTQFEIKNLQESDRYELEFFLELDGIVKFGPGAVAISNLEPYSLIYKKHENIIRKAILLMVRKNEELNNHTTNNLNILRKMIRKDAGGAMPQSFLDKACICGSHKKLRKCCGTKSRP